MTPPTSLGELANGTVTLTPTAVDVRGIEYRIGTGAWTRYAEATQTLTRRG